MVVTITMRGRGGSLPRPDSVRQRTRAACKSILAGGEYPTLPMLHGALPDVSKATLNVHRWALMRELGLAVDDQRVTLNLDRLALA